MEGLAFYALATVSVMAVLLMIFQRNPVASAIWLVVSFFALAGLYVLLNAEFVAALQVLVYAGAIMVLFVFVIMLLNLGPDELKEEGVGFKGFLVTLGGLGLFGLIAAALLKIPAQATFAPLPDNLVGVFGSAAQIGRSLITENLVPFQLVGLLLLAGLVGAVYLGRREEG